MPLSNSSLGLRNFVVLQAESEKSTTKAKKANFLTPMSLSKNAIKYIRSLHLKKFRQKYNNFVVEGDKIVREILQSNFTIEGVYAVESWIETHADQIALSQAPIFKVSITELERISALKTPNQVLAVAKQVEQVIHPNEIAKNWSLYLDGIQDPGNLGTILRIADWFGIPQVFCSPNTVEIYNPKVIQASMGAFMRVSYLVTDLQQLKKGFTDLLIYGAVMQGDNLFEESLPSKGILVFGNEGNGISPECLKLMDKGLTIPKGKHGRAESLNVSIAAGIFVAQLQK